MKRRQQDWRGASVNTPIIPAPSFRPSVWTAAAALVIVASIFIYALIAGLRW